MNYHYPPGTFELPGEKDKEKTYVFEVYGEVEVQAYSEEQAELELKHNFGELAKDAYGNGKIEYQ